MTRTDLERRLRELGTAIATGGVSDAYAGAKLWENLIEGTGGGGAGGKIPNFLPFHAARVAEMVRAVLARLDPVEQSTVWTMYCAGLHTRQLQAAALKIKLPALKARRRKIFVKLIDWFTPAARALRAIAAEGQAEVARQQRVADTLADSIRVKAALDRRAKGHAPGNTRARSARVKR